MSDINELKSLLEEKGKAWEALKEKMDGMEADIKTRGAEDVVAREQVDKIAAEIADIKGLVDRVEARINRPGAGGQDEKKQEQKEAFAKALRSKRVFEEMEQRAVDADYSTNSTSGGVAIPEVIASEILAKIVDLSPMRSLVRVTSVSTPNYERLVDSKGASSGWAAEATTRSETNTPTLNRVTFTHGELYAVPKASQWALSDIMFDVNGWLTDSVAEEMAYQEGLAIISGNGTNKPTGITAGTPAATGDEDSPARAFGTVEYYPTGTAASFGNDRTGSPAGDPGDILISTVYKLKAGYRANARWLSNKSTLATVMKWKDVDGNYLWRPGLAPGQPDSLVGYPLVEAEGMADIGANAFPLAFGDFRAGYELIDIVGMNMIRDDVTSKGHVLFYISRRLGGKVVNDDAIKLIKCATS